jgi:hypothetical protein
LRFKLEEAASLENLSSVSTPPRGQKKGGHQGGKNIVIDTMHLRYLIRIDFLTLMKNQVVP